MKRSLPLTAAAVLSAAALAAPTAPAMAAGHGHGSSHAHAHATKAHTHTKKTHDKLAHQLRGTSHAVANQVRQVQALLDLANTSTKVDDADRGALVTAVQADLYALTTVRDGLAGAQTHRDLVSALHQGILIRAIARHQVTTAVEVAALREQVTAAGASTDLSAQLDSALAAVLAVTPDSTRTELNAALSAVATALDAVEAALGTVPAPTDETPAATA